LLLAADVNGAQGQGHLLLCTKAAIGSLSYSDISVLKFISVLVSISFSVNHFYFYIISVLT